jgi:hypothetical protein
MNDIKNVLKSGGSRVVAINDLAQDFDSFQGLFGRFGRPVIAVIGWVGGSPGGKCAFIQ